MYTDPTGHSAWSKFWDKVGDFFKEYGGTIASVAFTFVGMPFVGAVVGSAISTIANGGNFGDFAVGLGVGMAAGFVGGSFTGAFARGVGMNLAGVETALLRGGLSGALAGAGGAAIYGGNIGKGALRGGLMGAGIGGLAWAKNNYTTNKFLRSIEWDSSMTDSEKAMFTQAIKEYGQSPIGQRTFGKYFASGAKLTMSSFPAVPGIAHAEGTSIGIRPDISAFRHGTPGMHTENVDMGTVFAHEIGHTAPAGGCVDPLNVSYNENPYRAWIGLPRSEDWGGRKVENKPSIYQY